MFVYFVEQVWTTSEQDWVKYPWFPTKEVAREVWDLFSVGKFNSWYPRHDCMILDEDYIEF